MAYDRKYKEFKNVSEYTPKETKADVQKYPILAIPERGLTKETCELLGIRSGLSEEDGKTVIAHYFPYYDQKGNLSGYKKRDLTKDKLDKFHFTAIGNVGVSCKLFGQQFAEANNRKHNNIIIVEGEYDVASALQVMLDSVKGTKYEGLKPFVVGLSCGTANAVEAVLHNEDFIRSFDEITFGLDGDEATPAEKRKGIKKGKEATEDLAGCLIGNNLYIVHYQGGHKDPSDYLQNDEGVHLAKLLQYGKKKFVAEKIAHASDISFDELIAPREEGVYVPQFPKLMDKLHGFRTRELVLVTSPSGVGKSTVTSMFASAFMEAGEKVAMIFLEETNKETLQRMVASRLKVNYLKFKNNPTSVAPVEKIREVYDSIVNDDNLIMLDHFGSLPISELMNKVKHMHLVEGCKRIILDHLSVVISGSAVTDERKEIDICMTEMAAFCAANDVTIIVVNHLNRSIVDEFKPAKGKEDQPFWVRIMKEQLRGSGGLEQLSWIVLALEPEILPNRERGRVRFTVLKNRPWSYLGVCDAFTVDDDTWEVLLMEDDVAY